MDVKIFVGNLTENSDSNELRALFEPFGEVTECDIVGNFGFVHMSSVDQANEAIEALNNYEFNGGNIRCELSTKKTQGRKRARESEDDFGDGGGGRGGRGRGGRGGPGGRGGFGRGRGRGGQDDGGMRGRGGRGGGRGGGGRFDPYADPYGEEPPMPARRRGPPAADYDPLATADLAYERDLYKEAYYDLYREVLARDPMLLREIRSGRPPTASRDPSAVPAAPRDPYARPPPDYYRRAGASDPTQSANGYSGGAGGIAGRLGR